MTQMDNFSVPKIINRHVVKALSILQSTLANGMVFVPVDNIVKQVEIQMRRNNKMNNLEHYVRKSLCSLTRLGVLVRSGSSGYALRQVLQFPGGVSAIPWKTVPKIKSRRSNRVAKVQVDASETKIAKTKVDRKTLKRRRPQVKLTYPNRRNSTALCRTCRTAFLTFVNGYMTLKQYNW